MSATSAQLIADSQSSSVTQDKTTYTCVFQVFVNSALDGPKVITDYMISQGYALGSHYSIGNDSDSSVILKSHSPKRHPKTQQLWLDTLTYETPDSDDTEDEDGDATSDPTEYYGQVSTGFVAYEFPVEVALNLEAHPMRPKNTPGPVMNSAGEIKIPAPTVTQHLLSVRLTKNLGIFNANKMKTYIDTINDGLITIRSHRTRFTLDILKFEGRVADIQSDWQRENGYDFWRVSTELHIKPGGWRLKELDAGIHGLARTGDPDGDGGVFIVADAIDGVHCWRHIRDKNGNKVTKPVLLNGQGVPAPEVQRKITPTYLTYSVDGEIPWKPFLDEVWPQ